MDRVCLDSIIDSVEFSFNEEIEDRKADKELIIENFKVKTPKVIKELLYSNNVKIHFRSSEFFMNRGCEESIAGFYNEYEKNIFIKSNLSLSKMYVVLHHEIGHFVDRRLFGVSYFEGVERKRMGSYAASDINKIMEDEKYIYLSSYFRDCKHEFFAQSYAEYILDTYVINKSNKTKEMMAQTIDMLSDIHKVLGSDIHSIRDVVKANDNVYVASEEDDRTNSYDICLYTRDLNKVLLDVSASGYTVSSYSFLGDDEKVITLSCEDGKKIYLLKDCYLCELDYDICDTFEDQQSFAKYKYALVRGSDAKYDFIINKNGYYSLTDYKIERYEKVSDSKDVLCWAYIDNESVLFDKNLKIVARTPGKYYFNVCKNLSFHIKDDSVVFFKDDDAIYMYSGKGKYIGECIYADTFTLGYDEDQYLFINYGESSDLINIATDVVIENKWDEIGYCSELTEILLYNNPYNEYSDTVKLKKNGMWSIGSVNDDEIIDWCNYCIKCDDVFHMYSCLNDSVYMVGVTFRGDYDGCSELNSDTVSEVEIVCISSIDEELIESVIITDFDGLKEFVKIQCEEIDF